MKKSCLIAVGICLVAVCQAFGQTNKEYYEQFFKALPYGQTPFSPDGNAQEVVARGKTKKDD